MNLDKFNELEDKIKEWEPIWNGWTVAFISKESRRILDKYPEYHKYKLTMKPVFDKYMLNEINQEEFKEELNKAIGIPKDEIPWELLEKDISVFNYNYNESASEEFVSLMDWFRLKFDLNLSNKSIYMSLAHEYYYHKKKGNFAPLTLWSLIKNYKFYVNYPGGMSDVRKKEYQKIFDYLEMTPEELEPTPEDYAWGIKYIISDEVKKKRGLAA